MNLANLLSYKVIIAILAVFVVFVVALAVVQTQKQYEQNAFALAETSQANSFVFGGTVASFEAPWIQMDAALPTETANGHVMQNKKRAVKINDITEFYEETSLGMAKIQNGQSRLKAGTKVMIHTSQNPFPDELPSFGDLKGYILAKKVEILR